MDTRQAIAAEYDRMMNSYKQKDVQAVYAGQTTTDFSMQQPDGQTLPRDTVRSMAAAEMQWVKEVQEWTVEIDKLDDRGHLAVADIRIHARATVCHPRGRDIADHTLTRENRALHTWMQTPQGWKLSHAQVLSDDGQWDGKPMPADLVA